MENLFITIVCIALILLATVSYASSSMGAADLLSNSFKNMAERARQIGRTDITATAAVTNADGSEVAVTLLNDGKTALRNYSRWDVIIRPQGGAPLWVPYSASAVPGWSDNGTFLNGVSDIFEPGILNPGETLNINVRLATPVAENTTNLATISTDTGVTAQRTFGW